MGYRGRRNYSALCWLKLKPLACQNIALSASSAARYAVFIICCLRLIQLHVSKFSLNMKLMCAVLKTLSSKQYVVSFVIYTVTLGFYLWFHLFWFAIAPPSRLTGHLNGIYSSVLTDPTDFRFAMVWFSRVTGRWTLSIHRSTDFSSLWCDFRGWLDAEVIYPSLYWFWFAMVWFSRVTWRWCYLSISLLMLVRNGVIFEGDWTLNGIYG